MSKKVVVENEFYALMPNGVYTKSVKRNVLSQISGFEDLTNPEIFEEEVLENLVLIWAAESKSIYKLKSDLSPSKISHQMAIHVRDSFDNNEDGIYLFKDSLKLSLVVLCERQIKISNSFDFNLKEDALYFSLFMKEKFNSLQKVFLLGSFSKIEVDFILQYCPKATKLRWSSDSEPQFQEDSLRAYVS